MFKKFKDSVSKTFSDISGKLGTTSNAISDMIKENNQYINAEESVVKESQEAIAVLKKYAETETPSLEEAITELANTFEAVEAARSEKVMALREEYIAPLKELLASLEKLQTEQKESERAIKEMEKAEKKVEKVKAKPEEKLKVNEIEMAEKELETAKENVEKASEDVKIETENFNKNKLETMQKVLNSLSEIESAYHKKALDAMKGVKAKAEAIKVAEESKVK